MVPFSPLGRGFLTGAFASADDLSASDFRHEHPRFQGGNFERTCDCVGRVRAIAAEKGCTAAQVALAWVMAQGDDVVPIPGTKRPPYLEENAGACFVELTDDDLARLEAIAPPGAAAGERYPFTHTYGDSPEPAGSSRACRAARVRRPGRRHRRADPPARCRLGRPRAARVPRPGGVEAAHRTG